MTTLFDKTVPVADGQTVQTVAVEHGPHSSVWLRIGGIGRGHSVRLSRSEALEIGVDLIDAYKAIKAHNNQQQKVGTDR